MKKSTKLIVLAFLLATIMISFGNSHPTQAFSNDGNNTKETSKQEIDASSFLRFLFRKYGREDVMTFEGLEHLLDNLGLGIVTSFGHGLQSHIDKLGKFVEFHADHRHTGETQLHTDDIFNGNGSMKSSHQSPVISAVVGNEERDRLNVSDENISCLSAREILTTFHIQYNGGIQTSEFLNLCPSLVYQLDQQLCRTRQFVKIVQDEITGSIRLSPWVGALSAVGTISIAGFVVVGIIPWIAKCKFYNILIQFLISLAVGTLTADALLHLLPHAMIPHSHERDGHDKHPIWIGLATFGAIVIFFILERFLKIFSDAKKQRKSQILNQVQSKVIENDKSEAPLEMRCLPDVSEFHKDDCIGSIEKLKELTVLSKGCQDDLDDNQKHRHVTYSHDHHHHHSHDHHHDHSHVMPTSIASVAWMVIMGDGLHNFTDGLAIGASFSKSIPIGLSTSVAVLCHELPHELGDFAVLLQSGIPVKQALMCNLLSSILCFMGTSLGIMIGNIDSITSWVFSVTAGIFIYIALVDMLPQLTSAYVSNQSRVSDEDVQLIKHREDKIFHNKTRTISNNSKFSFSQMGGFSHLLIHTMGILSGLIIMLIIAIYEDSITFNIY